MNIRYVGTVSGLLDYLERYQFELEHQGDDMGWSGGSCNNLEEV